MANLNLHNIDDATLLAQLGTLVGVDRRTQADLLRHLLEVDARRAFVERGFSSLWMFCHKGLGFSESMAQRRVMAVRAGRIAPEAFAMIEDGTLSLCTLAALAGVLTIDNRTALLARVRGLSRREVEAVVANIQGPSPKRDVVRPLAKCETRKALELQTTAPTSAGEVASRERVEVAPVAGKPLFEQVCTARRVSFTASPETWTKLERLREVLGERELDRVIGKAADALLDQCDPVRRQERREKRRKNATAAQVSSDKRPADCVAEKKQRRSVSQALRDEVALRDQLRCTWVSREGHRCEERKRLELHHIHARAFGGRDGADNLQLLCPAHHSLETKRTFGDVFVEERIAERRKLAPR